MEPSTLRPAMPPTSFLTSAGPAVRWRAASRLDSRQRKTRSPGLKCPLITSVNCVRIELRVSEFGRDFPLSRPSKRKTTTYRLRYDACASSRYRRAPAKSDSRAASGSLAKVGSPATGLLRQLGVAAQSL